MPKDSITHIADLVAQATTEKLVAFALILFLVLLILCAVLAWRFLPVLKKSNEEREKINHLIRGVRVEMRALRELILDMRRPFWQRMFTHQEFPPSEFDDQV